MKTYLMTRLGCREGGGGRYVPNYFLTDHLGSTRVVVDDSGNPQNYSRSDYYPFGQRWTYSGTGGAATQNRWLYNGKEHQAVAGLNFLDYGARQYDPILGRWHSIDPLTEKYYPWSSYNYALNNPIKFIDPDGGIVRIANNTAGALESYARIAATSLGSTVMNQLTSSRTVYDARSVFWTANSNHDNHTINYAGNPWLPRIDGGSASSMVILGHESFHAYQDDTRQIQYYNGKEKNRFDMERAAVGFENYLREVYDDGPMRNRYSGLIGNDGSLFNPLKFDTRGERITNFTSLGNNENQTSFGFSYDKKLGKSDTQTYYIVVDVDDDKNSNFQIYNTEDEYRKASSNW